MKFARRDFLGMAAGASILPVVALRPALAQIAPNPASVRPPSATERAAMARVARAFMEKYDVPALSFAVGYAGEIVQPPPLGSPTANATSLPRRHSFSAPASAR